MMNDDLLSEIEVELERMEASGKALKKLIRRLRDQGTLDLSGEPKQRTLTTKLAADWSVSAEELAWAAANFPRVDVEHETHKFRAYWHAKGARRADWAQTFRTWIARAESFNQKPGAAPHQRRSETRSAALAEANRERAGRALDKLSKISARRHGTRNPGDSEGDAD